MSFLKYILLKVHSSRLLLGAELCPPPQISMLKSNPPVPQNVTMFGDRTFKEVTELKRGQCVGPNPIWPVLVRGGRLDTQTDSRVVCAHQGDHVETQQEGSRLQSKERDLKRNQSHQHLNLGIGASKLWEKQFLLLKPPSPCYFVMAANQYICY